MGIRSFALRFWLSLVARLIVSLTRMPKNQNGSAVLRGDTDVPAASLSGPKSALLQAKARCPLRGFEQALEKFSQRDGIVVLRVMGAVEERYRALARSFENRRKRILPKLQLREIAPAKFIPALGVMTKPFAQLRAIRGRERILEL